MECRTGVEYWDIKLNLVLTIRTLVSRLTSWINVENSKFLVFVTTHFMYPCITVFHVSMYYCISCIHVSLYFMYPCISCSTILNVSAYFLYPCITIRIFHVSKYQHILCILRSTYLMYPCYFMYLCIPNLYIPLSLYPIDRIIKYPICY